MPTTRKSTRGSAAKGTATGKQSTLSFNNRVSKVGPAKLTGKDKDALIASHIVTAPPSKQIKVEEPDTFEDQAEVQADDKPQVEEAETKTQAEVRAAKITDAQIRKYWKGVEDARIARRVHQEELGMAEKVLRYFDISSQYGVSLLAFSF